MIVRSKFFSGRYHELKKLLNYAELAKDGNGILVGIKGDVGVGKSTLLRHFIKKLKSADRFQILLGHCIDQDAIPYLPFIESLRRHFKISGVDQDRTFDQIREVLLGISKDAVGLTPVIGPLLTIGVSVTEHVSKCIEPEKLDIGIGQGELFYAIQKLISGIAEENPLIIAVEDLNYADFSTLQLLQYLSRRIDHLPVMILVTFRESLLESESHFRKLWRRLILQGSAREITLSNFNEKEAHMYMREFFDQDKIDPGIIAVLLEQTGGNPFFLSQIIPVLIKEGAIVRRGGSHGRWTKLNPTNKFELPPSVEAAIEELLVNLQPQALRTLELASVIGSQFDYPLLTNTENMSDNEEVDRHLDILTKRHLIEELPEIIDIYEFVHEIIKEYIYDNMGLRYKRRLHIMVAQTMEKLYKDDRINVVERLAYHYHKGGDVGKAIESYLAAANKAISVLAYDDALGFYQKAMACLSEDDPRFLDLLEIMGKLADRTSQWNLARQYYERLEEISQAKNDIQKLGEAYEGIAMLEFREGNWTSARQWAEKHLSIAGEIRNKKEIATALFNLGQVYWRIGKLEESRKYLEKALDLQQEHDLDNRTPALVTVLGAVYRDNGKLKRALKLYQTSIKLFDTHNNLDRYWLGRIYNNMGTTLRSIAAEEELRGNVESENWERAIKAYRNSLKIMEKIGSLRDVSNTCNNLAIVYSKRPNPDLDLAMNFCNRAEKILCSIDSPIDLLDTLRIKGAVHCQMNQFEDALTNIQASLEMAKQLGSEQKKALAHLELGNLYKSKNSLDSALNHYQKAQQHFSRIGSRVHIAELQSTIEKLRI